MINLTIFNNNLFNAGTEFFNQLGIRLNSNTAVSLGARELLKDHYKDKDIFKAITETYFLGLVDDSVFDGTPLLGKEKISLKEAENRIGPEYKGLMVFAVKLNDSYLPVRGKIAELTRAFNRASKNLPVVLLLKYGGLLSFAASERTKYKQAWRAGEKIGKISLLKDINIESPHTGHLKILDDLKVEPNVTTFDALYKQWQEVFNVQVLNESFYRKIATWYYYATNIIKLPIRPEYYKDDKDNIKNFTVRLICRMIFCWFLKEKGLIDPRLFELYDYADNPIVLVRKSKNDFDKENSYYRGILQNVFLSCLNSPMNASKRMAEYLGKKYLPEDFDFNIFDGIPFLNGGLFDRLEEDNYNETIEDGPLYIPNELFYGKELPVGSGKKTLKTEGLNRILASYVFTVHESTPFEEEVALDPELLGLVFENLLAEIDPDEAVAKTARKESGSFYTPRKVIDYIVNESLILYLSNYFKQKGSQDHIKKLDGLIYFDRLDNDDKAFKELVVDALDSIKMLDPACGSGAFPMGMLHRIVSILKVVDPKNHLWLDKQLSRIEDRFQRDSFAKILKQHLEDYPRKLGIIKNVIYGIDNQPLAVLITKLRFFITLLIEQQIDLKKPEENYHITPLPNIETKIICADSLVDLNIGLFDEAAFVHLKDAKEKYYRPNLSRNEKEQIASEISEILATYFPDFSKRVTGKKLSDPKSESIRNKAILKQWFQHANLCAPFFNLDLFFPELVHQPFDIVIGNPPYGGNDISDEVKDRLALGKKDPYGAFIARFLGNGQNKTPLKNSGILSYIVSDTFMTIKTHFPLRRQMMRNYIHKMIRVHPDTFKATVNTTIIVCERNVFPKDTPADKMVIPEHHHCQMVDMTNISIHDDYERFLEILYKTEGFEERENFSSPEYAIYYYPQDLIRTNSNLPFFVASPKLFALMNDMSAPVEFVDFNGKMVQVRNNSINGDGISLVKLEQIAEAKQGLKTGDNDAYLFQNPDARGTYKNISEYHKFLLTEKDLIKFRNDSNLRMETIDKGISKGNSTSKRYLRGAYIVPLDKGGESDADEGWMPNYYVPTDYFIDWSEWAVRRMKTLTIKERDGKGENKVCSRFQNVDYFFREGITFSPTGIYAPSFRINSCAVFESKGSTIFVNQGIMRLNILIGLLASKLIKFLLKNYISHTVEAGEAAILAVNVPLSTNENIGHAVDQIISKQKKDERYDYAANEQLEIDRLVYEAYGLNDKDIAEVENWYARRYPKLVRARTNKITSGDS